jgi:hypothetical protein
MSDDEPKEAKVLSELDFGTYIAFFLPGVLGLYALIPFSKRVAELFTQVVTKDTTVGASFLLLVGGLVVGTVISGLRAVWLDRVLVWHKPKFNFRSLAAKDTRAAYKDAIANTYRFYQFYGNMFLALGFYVVARYVLVGVDYHSEKQLAGLDVVVLLGLFLQARKSLKSTYDVLGQILGVEPPGLSVVTCGLPNGKVGQSYKQPLQANGVPPFKWTLTVGALPNGVTLDPCGGLSGTPTAEGTATITLRLDDASGASQSKEFSITIDK